MADRTLRLGVDSRGAERGYRRARRASDRFTRSARGSAQQTNATTAAFRKLRRVAVGVAAVLGTSRLLRGLINTNREFQRLTAQLQTVEGSLAGANAQFARIERFAVQTPFEVENLTAALVQLRVRGANPTNEEITALGDLASSFTRDITEVADAVSSATAGMTRPLRRLGFEASVTGDQITLSFQGASTTVEREAGAIVTAMTELTSGRLSGAMEREMDTINGAASNLADTLGAVARTIGRDGGLNDAITSNIQALDNWLQKLNDVLPVWLDFIGTGDSAFAAERGGITAQLAGMEDPEQQLSFLNTRMRVEMEAINRLQQEIDEAPREGRGWLSHLQELNEQLETSEKVLEFLRQEFSQVASQIERAADAARELTTFERLRLALLTDVTGQIDTRIPAPDAGRVRASGRMEGPVDFNPFNVSADPSQFGGGPNLAQIDQAIRATASLANAAGGLDEEARTAIRGVSDLVGGISQLKAEGASTSAKILGGAGLIGGVVSLGRSIVDMGKAATEARLRIVEMIRSLEFSIAEFAGTATEQDRIIQEALSLAQQIESIPGISAQVPLEQAIEERLGFGETFGLTEAEIQRRVAIEALRPGTETFLGALAKEQGMTIPEFVASLEEQWMNILEGVDTNIADLGDEAEGTADALNELTGTFNAAAFGFKFDAAHFRARDFDVPGGAGSGGGSGGGGGGIGPGDDTSPPLPPPRDRTTVQHTTVVTLDGKAIGEAYDEYEVRKSARGGSTVKPRRRR